MEHDVVSGEVKLRAEYLPGSGPPCLLVGGAGAISAFWPDDFCATLQRAGYRVIRYDHRDAGFSSFVDFARAPYGLMDLVDDAMAILDHIAAPKAHVVGHSMGGFIAQLAAIHHPERVFSLTSISSHTAPPDLPPPPPRTWEVMLANKPRRDLDADLAGYMTVWRYLNADAPFDASAAEAYTRELYRRNPATLPATNHVAIQSEMEDRGPHLSELDTPTLVIHGEQDPLVPLRGGEITASTLPSSDLVVLPRAGHMFFNADTWAEIARSLIGHFQRSDGFVRPVRKMT